MTCRRRVLNNLYSMTSHRRTVVINLAEAKYRTRLNSQVCVTNMSTDDLNVFVKE